MERLKKGVAAFRNGTEHVGAKMKEKLATNSVGPGNLGASIIDRHLFPGHQYKIGPRTVEEEKQLNEGGFAFVWMVRDVHSDEAFALKKILCQDKANIAMARREVDILERLPPHPNVVKYHGHTTEKAGSNAREVMLLFELCPGGHLLDLLDLHHGRLSEAKILSVFREVCSAVSLLHTRSPPVQHRDLKVENILLGSDGQWKLCDFGSWSDEVCNPAAMDKQEVSKLTEQIERYTTMMYRPPEMVDFYQQFEITEKVDIWMLGCILFTLMYYRHPFQDESLLAISNARYDLPNEPAFSEKLEDLTRWCLARNPANRPDIKQICEILATFDSGGPLVLPQEVIDQRERHHRLYADTPTRLASDLKKDRGERKQAKDVKNTPRRAKSQRSHRLERNGCSSSSLSVWSVDEKVEWPSATAPTAVPPPTAWCDWVQPTPASASSTSQGSSSNKKSQEKMLSHSWPKAGAWSETPPSGPLAADDWDPFGNSPKHSGTSPGLLSSPEVSPGWQVPSSSWPTAFSQSREGKAPDRGASETTIHDERWATVAQGSSIPEAQPWSVDSNARQSASFWPFGAEAAPDKPQASSRPVLVRANTAPASSCTDWQTPSTELEPNSPPTSPFSSQSNGASRRHDSTPQSRSPWDPLLPASNGSGGIPAVGTLGYGSNQAPRVWAPHEDPYDWLTPRPAPKVL